MGCGASTAKTAKAGQPTVYEAEAAPAEAPAAAPAEVAAAAPAEAPAEVASKQSAFVFVKPHVGRGWVNTARQNRRGQKIGFNRT